MTQSSPTRSRCSGESPPRHFVRDDNEGCYRPSSAAFMDDADGEEIMSPPKPHKPTKTERRLEALALLKILELGIPTRQP